MSFYRNPIQLPNAPESFFDKLRAAAQEKQRRNEELARMMLERQRFGAQQQRDQAAEQRARRDDARSDEYLGMQRSSMERNQRIGDEDRQRKLAAERASYGQKFRTAAEAGDIDTAAQYGELAGMEAPKTYRMGEIQVGPGGMETSGLESVEQGDLRGQAQQIADETAERRGSVFDYAGDDPEEAAIYADAKRAASSGVVDAKTAYTEMNDRLMRLQQERNRLKQQEMRNAGKARGSGGGGGGNFAIPPKALTAARQVANDVLRQFDFKGTQGQLSKFDAMADQIASGNAASDAVVMGSFVKMAQGGTGVISDNDMKVFWEKIGSIGVQTSDQVAKAVRGEMGDSKRKIVQAAVQQLADSARARIGTIRDALSSSMKMSVPGAHDWAMATYFGEGKPAAEPNGKDMIINAAKASEERKRGMAQKIRNGGRTDDEDDDGFLGGVGF